MRSFSRLAVVTVLACAACGGETARGADDTATESRPVARALTECYRSPASVMGRTTPLAGRTAVAPGWLRFDSGAGTDSGTVQLIDADGADFQARWRRIAADSVEIRGLNDFMEITLRAEVADSALAGSGLVTSDADVQRNAAGQLEPLRREWALTARAAPCDGVPAVAR